MMQIRKAKLSDAQRISYLIRKNADKVLALDYSKVQLIAWKNSNTLKAIANQLKQREIFCAFENDRLVGTIGLRENEVLGLYVSYSRRGKGIGKKLLNHLEEYAKKNGITALKLTSTPSANTFYQRNGYVPQGSVIVNVNGVNFKETKMTKNIK